MKGFQRGLGRSPQEGCCLQHRRVSSQSLASSSAYEGQSSHRAANPILCPGTRANDMTRQQTQRSSRGRLYPVNVKLKEPVFP